MRGQEERERNIFYLEIRDQMGQLFYVYTCYMMQNQLLLVSEHLVIHAGKGTDDEKCEFMLFTARLCIHA